MRVFFTLFFILSLSLASWSQSLVKCAVKLNGKNPVEVNSYYPDSEPYLEVEALSTGMGWKLGSGDPKIIKLDGKRIKDFKTYKNKRYVSAQALADEFEYTLKSKQRGEIIEFWTADFLDTDQPMKLTLRVINRKKRPAPGINDRIIFLKFTVQNQGSQPIKLSSRKLQIQDIKGHYHLCQHSYPLTLEAGQKSKPQELSYRVPKNLQLKKLVVKDENDKVVASARI